MSTSNGDSFKDEWQKALENAEIEPSPFVWDKIVQTQRKKRILILLYYFTPVLLLLLVFTLTILLRRSSSPQGFVVGFTPIKETDSLFLAPYEDLSTSVEQSSETSPGNHSNSVKSSSVTESKLITTRKKSLEKKSETLTTFKYDEYLINTSIDSNHISGEKTENIPSNMVLDQNSKIDTLQESSRTFQTLSLLKGQAFGWLSPTQVKALDLPENCRINVSPTKNSSVYPYWLSLSFGSLSFQPKLKTDFQDYLQTYTNAHHLDNVNSQGFFNGLKENTQDQLSFSFSLKMGYQFRRHLVIRGGLELLTAKNTLYTNALFVDYKDGKHYAFLNDVAHNDITNRHLRDAILHHPSFDPSSQNVLKLSEFNENHSIPLNQQYQFLSFPLELGWVLSPKGHASTGLRKFAFTTFAGITANLFLQSRFANMQIDNNYTYYDTQSAFRKWSWWAKVGLETAYRYNIHWTIIIEPNFSKAINALEKEGTYLHLSPQIFELKAGLRYNF